MAFLAPWIMSSWTAQNRRILKMHHAFYWASKLSCCLNFDLSSPRPALAIEYLAVCRGEVFPHLFMPSNVGIFVFFEEISQEVMYFDVIHLLEVFRKNTSGM